MTELLTRFSLEMSELISSPPHTYAREASINICLKPTQ